MSAYRFADPAPVQFNLLGTARAANGFLQFYDQGMTTPKSTYSDQALTIANTNPVELDSAARPETDIWLDGPYTVVLLASDLTTIWTKDVSPQIPPGLAIPSLIGNTGFFLSNDGVNPIWVELLQLPDPTGSPGYMVVVNATGDGYILQAVPTIPEPDITVITSGFTAGGGDALKFVEQWGSGTAPASGGQQTTANIIFSTPYKSGTVPMVSITPTNSQSGGYVTWKIEGGATSTGFPVTFDVAEGNTGSPNFSAPQNFQWSARGVIDA